MTIYETLNDLLVNLFREIWEIEEKAIITEEFKDITGNDMHIIEAIGIDEEKNMSTIARKLGVTMGTLTTAMNGLVTKEYVIRQRDVHDRRVVNIRLTEKGCRAYAQHQKFHKEMIDKVMVGLNEEELNILCSTLKKISNFFRTYELD